MQDCEDDNSQIDIIQLQLKNQWLENRVNHLEQQLEIWINRYDQVVGRRSRRMGAENRFVYCEPCGKYISYKCYYLDGQNSHQLTKTHQKRLIAIQEEQRLKLQDKQQQKNNNPPTNQPTNLNLDLDIEEFLKEIDNYEVN